MTLVPIENTGLSPVIKRAKAKPPGWIKNRDEREGNSQQALPSAHAQGSLQFTRGLSARIPLQRHHFQCENLVVSQPKEGRSVSLQQSAGSHSFTKTCAVEGGQVKPSNACESAVDRAILILMPMEGKTLTEELASYVRAGHDDGTRHPIRSPARQRVRHPRVRR